HSPQLVHAAVGNLVPARVRQETSRRRIDLVDEADFPSGSELFFKDRHDVLLAETMRDQVELHIFRRPGRLLAQRHLFWIGYQESGRAAESRLRVAGETLIRVV